MSSARIPSRLAINFQQFSQFVFDLFALQAGQRTQLHSQDGLGLNLAEFEFGLIRLAWASSVVSAGPDGLNDFVNVVERGFETF